SMGGVSKAAHSPEEAVANYDLIYELTNLTISACHFMCKEYNPVFCRIMFEPLEGANIRRATMTDEVATFCAELFLQNVTISEALLNKAKEYYIYAKEILVHEEHDALMDRCPACRARNGTFDRLTRVETGLKHAISVTAHFLRAASDASTKPKSILK